jgi:hypothetical protein
VPTPNDPGSGPDVYCFETFAFPWPPGQEPAATSAGSDNTGAGDVVADAGDDHAGAGSGERQPSSLVVRPASLKDRTLTNLYNKRPDWLDAAHRALDAAVFAAYGWPPGLSDDESLAWLLALNLQRAGAWPAHSRHPKQ